MINVLLLLLIAHGGLASDRANREPDTEPIPMQKGTRWIYRGSVDSQGQGDGIQTTRLDWKMEILDSAQRGRYKVALLLGHPIDLAWYEEGREPACHLLIAVDDREFYLAECPPTAPGEDLVVPSGDLSQLVGAENLIFKLPLKQHDVFAGDSERNDTMYAWFVQSVTQTKLSGVKGVSPTTCRTEYELIYRTLPDHQIATYVPGIGLTSYIYSHHGTVSYVDVRLVEFQRPASKGKMKTP